jgi:CDP-diacylglycerol--glycerol-3-phosphate 3-phosphatidyltransferase
MINFSNGLSFSRAPLAFLFLSESPTWRLIAVLLAMFTDSIDGYVARRSRSVSRIGAVLDPVMDKFFVYFALLCLCVEGKLSMLEAAAMLSRDFFLLLYGLVIVFMGKWKTLVFRAIRWGKITTALQFVVLASLIYQFSFSWPLYSLFVVMGILAFFELFQPRPAIQK